MTERDILTATKYLTTEEIEDLKRVYPNILAISEDLDERKKQYIRKSKLQYYYNHKNEIAQQRRLKRQMLKNHAKELANQV